MSGRATRSSYLLMDLVTTPGSFPTESDIIQSIATLASQGVDPPDPSGSSDDNDIINNNSLLELPVPKMTEATNLSTHDRRSFTDLIRLRTIPSHVSFYQSHGINFSELPA